MNIIINSILAKIQKDIEKKGYSNYIKRNKKLIKTLRVLAPKYVITTTSDFDIYLERVKR